MTGYLYNPLPTAADAKASVLAAIERATTSILDAYPRAERLGWDAKAAEAKAFLGAENGTLAMAPLLVAECAAEFGEATEEQRLAQLAGKAAVVAAKAAAYGALMANISGFRGRAYAAIDAAQDGIGIREALAAALVEAAALAEG